MSSQVFAHPDMLPTLLAAAGEPDIVEKCKKGHKAGNKTFKVHLDGNNLLPFLKGDVKANPRSDLIALRIGPWKVHFMIQEAEGVDAWRMPFVPMRLPKLFHLPSDPFERADESMFYHKWVADRADESMFYHKWVADRMFTLVPAKAIVGEFMKSFKEYPPRQKPSSFTVDKPMEQAAQADAKLAGATAGGPK